MNLNDILDNLSDTRVLVVGDLMLDHYIWGDIFRISPEAPVPVVHANRDTYTAGGAANVALNLANLGVSTSILGYCCHDEAGERLSHILSANKVKLVHSWQPDTAPTIIKTRVVVRNQQLCRIDREAARDSYRIDNAPGFDKMLEAALDEVDAVIISDYAKGVITQPLLNKLFNAIQFRPNLLVAVDPKPSRRLFFQGAGLLTPNRLEALELAGYSDLYPDEDYPLEEVCRRIHEIYKPNLLVITLGADGMALSREGEVLERLPTVAREVFDVSGAGDTVIATLTAALASGAILGEAARLANAAAGCVVAHMGTVPVERNELSDWLDTNTQTEYSYHSVGKA